jgi:hypothetical protein
MNAESFRQLLERRPFEPFEVRMTNGDVHPIPHPECAWLAGSRLFIHYLGTERVAICSLLHIASIEMLQPN